MRFRVMTADCPWRMKDQLPGPGRGASKKYKTMPTEDLARMPYGGPYIGRPPSFKFPEMLDDSILFFWRLAAMQMDAFRIIDAWNYEVKTELVWAKYFPCVDCKGAGTGYDNLGPGGRRRRWQCDLCNGTGCGAPAFGMGWYLRGAHETCLIATRGKMTKKIRSHSIRSVLHAPMPLKKNGRPDHSAKPERFYTEVVEKLVRGPYVELFGRAPRKGWSVMGNQVHSRRRA